MPVFFLLVSAGVFFTYIDPQYQKIGEIQEEHERLDQALTKSKELQEVRNALISRYNTFSRADIDRLQKLLPDHIDNVRLIIDIDSIAAAYGLEIQDFGFSKGAENETGQEDPALAATPNASYGSVLMDFKVNASYTDFLVFLRDLERSLRLVDVVGITVSASDPELYSFDVTIRTYWLH